MDYSNSLNSSPAGLPEHEAMSGAPISDRWTGSLQGEERREELMSHKRWSRKKDPRNCSKTKHG